MTRWDEVLAMLGDLARWVEEVREETAGRDGAGARPADPRGEASSEEIPGGEAHAARSGDVDLGVLLAELTALRHEAKLQTRSAHQDREQAGQSLASLARAVENFERLRQEEEARLAAAVERSEAPWVELLVDLHDALSRSLSRADQEALRIEALAREPLARPAPRAWALPWRRRNPAGDAGAGAAELIQRVEGLVEGLRLGAVRVERALRGVGVEPVEAKGRPVDLECMEVVQIASDATLPPDLVVDEVRRGYRKAGSVYRWAQVVANRPQPDAHTAGNGSDHAAAARRPGEEEVDAWT
jgi:molecular chaperone GrpE